MEGPADQTHSSRASSPRGLEDEEDYGDEDDVIHESDKEDEEEDGDDGDHEHTAREGDDGESEEADEERAARKLRRWRVHSIISLVVLLVVLLSSACGGTMSVVVLLSHVVEVDRTNGLEFPTRVVFFAASCAGLVYVAMHVYVATLGFGSSSRRVIPSHVPLVAVLAQFLSVLAVLAWLAAVVMRSLVLLKFGRVSFSRSTAGLLEILVSAVGLLSSANLILLIETSDRPFATAIISPHWFIHRLPVEYEEDYEEEEEEEEEEEQEEEEEANNAQANGSENGRRQASTRREAPKRTFSVISSTADGRSGRGRDTEDGRNDVPPMPALPDLPYLADMPALQSVRSSWATTVWDGRDPRDDFAWRPVMDLASLRQSGVTSFDSLPTPGAPTSRGGSRATTPAESAVGGTSSRANKSQDTEPPMPRMSMMPRPRTSLAPPQHFIPPLPPMPPFTYNPYMPYTPTMHTPPPMPPPMASRPVSMAPSRRLSIPWTVVSNPVQYPPPTNTHLPAFRPDAPEIERDDGDREHGDAPRPLDTRLLSPTSVIAGFAPPRPRTSMARERPERPDLRRMSAMSSSARSYASGPPPSMRSWTSGPVPSARGSVYTVRQAPSYHSGYMASRESRWAEPRYLPAVREEMTPPGWPRRYGPPPPNPWAHYPPRTPTGPGPWGPGPRYQSPGPSNLGPMPYPPRMPPGHGPYPSGHASYPPRTPPSRMMTPPAWAPMPRHQSPGPGRPMFLPPRTPPRSMSPAPSLGMPPMPGPGRMTPPPDMGVPPMPPLRLMNPPVRTRTPSPTNMLPPIPPMPPIRIMTPPPSMMMPTPTRTMTPPVRMRTPPAPDSPSPSFNFSRPRTAAAAVMQARLGRRVQAAQAQASAPAEMYEFGVEDDFAVVLEPRPRTSAARLMHHAVGRRLLAAGQ